MSGNVAINPYGVYNDPYFLAAYQSYNPNYAAQAQYNPYAAQYNPNVVQNQGTLQNTQFAAQPAANTEQPAKKKSKAGLVIGTIAVASAAILCHGKGAEELNLFPRIWDGAKKYWKVASTFVQDYISKHRPTT